MAKIYKALESFKIITNKLVTIDKDQVIVEDFFSVLPNPGYEISVLINGKKIKEVTKEKELADYSKAELVEYAKEKGIEIDATAKKDEIVKTIQESEAKK